MLGWTHNKQHYFKPKGVAWVCAALGGSGEDPRLSLIPDAVSLLQSVCGDEPAGWRWWEPVGRRLAQQRAEVILARGFKARDARVDCLRPRIRTLACLAQNAVTPRQISGGTSKPNKERKQAVALGKIKFSIKRVCSKMTKSYHEWRSFLNPDSLHEQGQATV